MRDLLRAMRNKVPGRVYMCLCDVSVCLCVIEYIAYGIKFPGL